MFDFDTTDFVLIGLCLIGTAAYYIWKKFFNSIDRDEIMREAPPIMGAHLTNSDNDDAGNINQSDK